MGLERAARMLANFPCTREAFPNEHEHIGLIA